MTQHAPAIDLPTDLDRLELALLQSISELTRSSSRRTATADDKRERRLDPATAAELFEAQVESRLVDHTARWLRSEHGAGYYTIGSAGHESNGAVALALRPTDPALLHYRSGGFYFARASQVANQDPTGDVLRGMLALTTDQIAGGRHKVFGNKALNIIPQTSTIGSHLPRAVGLAVSIGWGRVGSGPEVGRAWPDDAIVVCSFGDASLNHSSAQGAINWACVSAIQGQAVPLLLVCEDNGLGISVATPTGWVERSTRTRPGLNWASADGHAPAQVFATAAELADQIRASGQPGLLHLRTVRYLGHAGTDVETAYRSPGSMRVDLDHDPILGTAREIVAAGICDGHDLVAWYLETRTATRRRALELRSEPELQTASEILAPLAPHRPAKVASQAASLTEAMVAPPADESPGAGSTSGRPGSMTLAQTINRALASVMDQKENALVFGEDVGRKGGVYGVTRGLQNRFGPERVFDTILDEHTVLGLALGAGLNGYLPIAEIQYLAYLHNAEDQLRGEGATLGFFSNGQYRNPMVVRIAGYAYQRGFGGHFHNDNSVAVLRDIPGLVIASPSHPSDAGAMLMSCVAAADTDGTISAFLEPIARYHTADLHQNGDGLWTAPPTDLAASIGSARTHGTGSDGTILTWGNGLFLSLRVQEQLRHNHNEHWRVVDLRWLAPLPVEDMIAEAEAGGRVLVVDETRRNGGVGEAVLAALVESGFRGPMARVAAEDSFVPLGAAANLVLVSEAQILAATRTLDR